MGVALGMLLLVGASIAFAASQALDNRGGSARNDRSNHAQPPAPILLAPSVSVTREQTAEVHGVLPAGLRDDESYLLRLYVNGGVVRERALPTETDFTLAAVPLVQGDNQITASIVGDGGEGAQSGAVSIVRDDLAPVVRLFRPEDGATLYTQSEQLRGKTEAGATLLLTTAANDQEIPTTTFPDGRFEATLTLSMGPNSFVLRSEDAAGNKASTRFTVTRAQSLANIALTVSAAGLSTDDLPTTVQLLATIRDDLGHPAEGAEVTFSLSPPNRATTTYRATATGGVASWANVSVPDDSRSVGTWLVTVLAVLPSGGELRGDASFRVQ
jgi:hypothetical protein